MTKWVLGVIDAVRAIRQDARVWVHHLTGEGPATVRRQRETVAHALGTVSLAPSARASSSHESSGRPEAPTVAAPPGRRPAFTTR